MGEFSGVNTPEYSIEQLDAMSELALIASVWMEKKGKPRKHITRALVFSILETAEKLQDKSPDE